MPDLLIRDLDRKTHRELKRRAQAAGVSLQVYVTHLLAGHVTRPTVDEWLERLEALEPVEQASGADAVAAARKELP